MSTNDGFSAGYGDRVWRGDATTVVEARERYQAGLFARNILPYASALYSFRDKPEYAKELIFIKDELRAHEPALLMSTPDFKSHVLDRIDMLSTYYAWFSERPELSEEEREMYHARAISICKGALRKYPSLFGFPPQILHSILFVMLNFAALQPDTDTARNSLERVSGYAPQVPDKKQRSRIYAKLGVQFRAQANYRRWWWLRGFRWGVLACLVLGVPLNVRAKAVASLLGVKR